jgi:hypothetical protein
MSEPQVLVFRGNTMPSQQKNGHQENDNIIVRKFGSSLQPGLSYTNNDSPSVLPLDDEPKQQQQKKRAIKRQMQLKRFSRLNNKKLSNHCAILHANGR